MEMFIGISCFYFSHRLFQIAEACGDKLRPIDVLKAFARKLIRILPVYWVIFFMSWGLYPRLGSGPTWYISENLFATCNDDWWTRLLLIGNLY